MPHSDDNHELARQIADDFGEPEEFALFITLLRQYPEFIIRRAYEEAQKIPDHKIRKSRAAIFLYLVRKFATQQQSQPSTPPESDAQNGGEPNNQLPPVPSPPNPSIPNV